MTIRDAAGATDTGHKRRRNEDAYVCEPPLFAVADGMGGHQAGEVASRLAAAALREDVEPAGGAERVEALIREANRRIWQQATEDVTASGMGTTVTVALVEGDTVTIGHVGDSRAYRIRGGQIEQLTDDHSLAGELERSGKLSAEEARMHPQRSVITRALGTEPEVEIDTFAVEGRPGDVYLLCSDGLSSMVDDAAILAVVEGRRGDLEVAARELVRAANRSGGEDNITVVCFELGADGDEVVERTRESVPDEEDTLDGGVSIPAVEAQGPRERTSHAPRWLVALPVVIAVVGLVLWGLSR
jgi:serine/threonine protein phosphatase PrpC